MKNYRWFIIGLAFLALIIIYLDRMALSYAILPLESLFHLSNADFGILAAGFGVGYLFMTLGGGILADSYGPRKIWSISAILWSIACIMLGFATGFWWLFLFRLLLGAAEGPSFPTLSRVTADWLLPKEQARAFAFALVAVPLSSLIGAPLISALVAKFGWRIMFISIGSLGIIWAIIWYILFRDHPHQNKFVSAQELHTLQSAGLVKKEMKHPSSLRTSWRFMLFNPSLLSNHVAFFSFGYLVFFSVIWLPGYFQQMYHLKLMTTGTLLIIPWLFASIMLLLGGFLSDWLWQRHHSLRRARSHIIWICQMLSAFFLILTAHSHVITNVIIYLSLGLGFGLMPNSVFYAINTDLAKDRAGTSLGIMECAFALAGILAPYITGLLSDLTGNFNMAIYLMATITIISAIGIIIFQHPDKVLEKIR